MLRFDCPVACPSVDNGFSHAEAECRRRYKYRLVRRPRHQLLSSLEDGEKVKTLFVAVACLCLLAVVAARGSRPSLSRESSGPEPKISAFYDEEPIQLSREESKKCEYKIVSAFAVKTYGLITRYRS